MAQAHSIPSMGIAMGDIPHTTMGMEDNHHEDPTLQIDTLHRDMVHQVIRILDHLALLAMEDTLLMALAKVHLGLPFLDHTVMVDFRPRILGDLVRHHHLGHLHHHHHLRIMIIPYLLLAERNST